MSFAERQRCAAYVFRRPHTMTQLTVVGPLFLWAEHGWPEIRRDPPAGIVSGASVGGRRFGA